MLGAGGVRGDRLLHPDAKRVLPRGALWGRGAGVEGEMLTEEVNDLLQETDVRTGDADKRVVVRPGSDDASNVSISGPDALHETRHGVGVTIGESPDDQDRAVERGEVVTN